MCAHKVAPQSRLISERNFIIFGTTAILAGFLSFLFPETRGKKLPETIEEGEILGTKAYDEVTAADTDREKCSEMDHSVKIPLFGHVELGKVDSISKPS